MSMLEQQFNSAARGAIVGLSGREWARPRLGWTGRRAEWITPVCLSGGVFTRARWAQFMDARAEQLRRGGPVDRAGVCRRGHPLGRGSTSKGPMRRVEPERPRLLPTGLLDAAKAGEPAYSLGPRFAGPRRRLAGGRAPSDPATATARVGRAGPRERAEWHAKARFSGLTLADLVRPAVHGLGRRYADGGDDRAALTRSTSSTGRQRLSYSGLRALSTTLRAARRAHGRAPDRARGSNDRRLHGVAVSPPFGGLVLTAGCGWWRRFLRVRFTLGVAGHEIAVRPDTAPAVHVAGALSVAPRPAER